MCGIAGKLLFDRSGVIPPELLARMASAIVHRGPDDGGVWTDGPIGLASRRLAVIDLSPRGHQPMANDDGRLRVVYNGEIYNFQQLRADLQRSGYRFRSDTDTEVLLALYDRLGAQMVTRLRGMFAFALWDHPRRRLVLARDRLGKKPLFYFHGPDSLVFGSEPKSLLQDPDVPAAPDEQALSLYLGLGYVPSPLSAFRGMRKLPPAHVAIVENGALRLERYWTLHYRPKRREREEALIDELRERLRESVRLRLVSDVPIGALLSGGLDSSVIVALMCREHRGRVKTFSIGFDETRYDESAHAATVASHLGPDHHELIVRPDAVAMIDRLVWHYNEPYADSSALPAMALSELARTEVTVALSGDGGDEAFIGYERYLALAAAARLDRLPGAIRRLAAASLSTLPTGEPRTWQHSIHRFARGLALSPVSRYVRWIEIFDPAMVRRLTARASHATPESMFESLFVASDGDGPTEAAANADISLYLPDDLLVKMDIASMSHSLEVRSPFLDHQIVEFGASLPLSLKLRGRTLKYLVRKAFARELPPQIVTRPKMGFGVPLGHWFRNDLRELAHDVLLDRRACERGYLHPSEVRRYLDEHMSGRAHHDHRLWALLMLELWNRAFIDQRSPVNPPPVRAIEAGVVHSTPAR